MAEKDNLLVWLQGEVKTPLFSAEAQMKAGFLLRRLQQGKNLEMPDSRPMPSLGKHCHELRINDLNKTWRIVYFIDDDAIVILEVFAKNHRKHHKKLSRYVRKDWHAISNNKNLKTMDKQKRKNLEEKGFRIGSTGDFLDLTPEEEAYIEIRLEISNFIKTQRTNRGWTQQQLVRAMGSSQSRIAKMETGDASTSLDLMIKALLRLGISKQQIGKLLEENLEPA